MVVFFLLARTTKKIKILYFISLIFSVVFFYLLIPNGRVIGRFLWFNITMGALEEGFFRAFTLCGYVFLSLWCISPKLTFKGKIGGIFSHSLRYLHSFYVVVSDTVLSFHRNKTTHTIPYFDIVLIKVLSAELQPNKTRTKREKKHCQEKKLEYGQYINRKINYYFVCYVVIVIYVLFLIDYFFKRGII